MERLGAVSIEAQQATPPEGRSGGVRSRWTRIRAQSANRSAAPWAGESAWRRRPLWVRLTVVLLVLTEGVVSAWNIGRAQYNLFYADSTRSMSMNWHALLTGSADPSGSITLDKLSGFLLPQVLSVRLFGFHPWSTMLPQVLEGMITVLAAYVIGARWKGVPTGLMAAAALTVTPLVSSMFGRSSEDAMITMALALAFWCWQSAVLSGRLLPLMLCCGWVAVGFQAKMMQAWFIIPALVVGYLLATHQPWRQRIRRASAATVVTSLLSLSWVIALSATPPADRPFIDGTTNNNAFTMVFGYNGFNRVLPSLLPGVIGDRPPESHSSVPAAVHSGVAGSPRSAVRCSHVRSANGSDPLGLLPAISGATFSAAEPPARANPPGSGSPCPIAATTTAKTAAPAKARPVNTAADDAASTSKLLKPEYLTQIGWLYPLAAAGLLLSLLSIRRRLGDRRRRIRQPDETPDPAIAADLGTGIAMAIWLLIDVAFLTTTTIPHTSYLAAVTVQLAVLAAVGLTATHRWWADAAPGPRRWVFPALLAAQTGWTLWTLDQSQVAPRHLSVIVAVAGLVVVAGTLWRNLSGRAPRTVLGAAALVALMAPVVWTSFNVTAANGAYADAYGGPAMGASRLGHPAGSEGGQQFHIPNPFDALPDPQLAPAQASLISYLRRHVPAGAVMFATDSWRQAEPYLLDDAVDVIPMGGYTGRAPTPTLPQITDLVARQQVRFFLLHNLSEPHSSLTGYFTGNAVGPGTIDGANTLLIRDWITQHCQIVSRATYEPHGQSLSGQTLYDCDPPRSRNG